MIVTYTDQGIEKSTDNVWVEWPDGYCWLVVNEWGVIGAVITMEDNDAGWHSAYECAVDEIAHDFDCDDDEDMFMALHDGIATYRGSGVPSNPRRKSAIADTQYLTVIRNVPESRR
jgi:hypothetical protein